MLTLVFIVFILSFYLLQLKDTFRNYLNHSKLVKSCFSQNELNTIDYSFSKIVYGKNSKSICYLTPTKYLNEIPIISWNGYYINNFCVETKYRGNGYGTELLDKIIKIATKEKKDHLILQVDDNNEDAKQLYYNFGFVDYFKGTDKYNTIKLFLVKYL